MFTKTIYLTMKIDLLFNTPIKRQELIVQSVWGVIVRN